MLPKHLSTKLGHCPSSKKQKEIRNGIAQGTILTLSRRISNFWLYLRYFRVARFWDWKYCQILQQNAEFKNFLTEKVHSGISETRPFARFFLITASGNSFNANSSANFWSQKWQSANSFGAIFQLGWVLYGNLDLQNEVNGGMEVYYYWVFFFQFWKPMSGRDNKSVCEQET